ncbi:RNA exonuclease 1 [Dendrobium catenatum]|uniref:RNA exonuclease 1 n=1 Tax=Dendrobium catenatum TaxID=906689 RepID=A0A2I0WV38_9ASPA|nr:RNA exonuclease 1 [Dendrobium catenatum]
MLKLWQLKGSMSLLSLADGFFLLKFSTEEDLEMILSGGPWFIRGKPFILQRWSPKFKPKRDEDAPIPVWIKIVDFPLALWTPTSISKISSYIGIPISVDSLTANRSRLTFARVCVLISKDSILPEEIPIEIEGEDLTLKVLYDWKPGKCEGCGSLIHPFSLCPKNPNPQPPKFRGRSSSRPPLIRNHRSNSSVRVQIPNSSR